MSHGTKLAIKIVQLGSSTLCCLLITYFYFCIAPSQYADSFIPPPPPPFLQFPYLDADVHWYAKHTIKSHMITHVFATTFKREVPVSVLWDVWSGEWFFGFTVQLKIAIIIILKCALTVLTWPVILILSAFIRRKPHIYTIFTHSFWFVHLKKL